MYDMKSVCTRVFLVLVFLPFLAKRLLARRLRHRLDTLRRRPFLFDPSNL